MDSSVNSGYVPVDNGKLHYETLGNSKDLPLVFIHAGFLDCRMWDEQFNLFSKEGFWSIRYDTRGSGKSERPKKSFDDALDLKDLLESIVAKNRKVAIIGLSNGGSIAIDFALKFPSKVKCLVLVAPTVNGYEYADANEEKLDKAMETEWSKWEEAIKNGRLADAVEIHLHIMASSLNEETKTRISKIALENYGIFKDPIDHLRTKMDPPAFKRLTEIKMPTLLVWGDKDYPGQISLAERVQSFIPGSKKILIHGADHLVNLSQSEVFNRVILNYLRTQKG
jgi:pimeloyl-ACP methyl ester carboxylesterase